MSQKDIKHKGGAILHRKFSKRELEQLGASEMTSDLRYLAEVDKFALRQKLTGSQPSSKSYRANMGTVWNQGATNSCVGQAIVAQIQFHRTSQNNSPFILSRSFIYWTAREKDGLQGQDAGCIPLSAWSEFQRLGSPAGGNLDFNNPNDSGWNYQQTIMTKPSTTAYSNALANKCGTFYYHTPYDTTPGTTIVMGNGVTGTRSQHLKNILQFTPVCLGFDLFPYMYSAPGGVFRLPTSNDVQEGGHYVVITGYNDSTQRFEFKNSWGTSWGDGGYGYLPYAFVNTPGLTDSPIYAIQST